MDGHCFKPKLASEIAFLLLFLLSLLHFPVIYGDSEEAYLLIDPPAYVAKETSEIYVVSVNISNVKNLHKAYLSLAYNSSFLDVTTISQGSFFPRSQSHFDFKLDSLSGLIEVNLSLTNSAAALNGDGSLVKISFKVIQNSTSCAYSTLNFRETLLLNPESTPIAHQSVGAVIFWKSIYDPYIEGGSLDVYTQKAGKGPDEPGGTFLVFDVVYLFSEAKYNNWSTPQQLVTFQVINPHNETILVRTAITNQEGVAKISFRIPPTMSSIGVWVAISTVSLVEKVIWDATVFKALPIPTVGGNTVGGDVNPMEYKTDGCDRDNMAFYLVTVLTLTLFYTLIRRKSKGKCKL